MYDSTGPLKFANVDESAAASTAIIAAVTGKKIRILGLVLVAAGAVDVTIEDEDGGNLIGLMSLAANGSVVLPVSGVGYQETPAGKALHLLLGGAVQVGGSIDYQEI